MFNNHAVTEDGSSLAKLLSEPSLGARRRLTPAGSPLHDVGAPADNLFFVQSGQIRQYQLFPDGSRRLLDIVGPGQWLGVESICGQANYPSQAIATIETTTLVVPARQLLAALPQHPQASMEIIRRLADRLNVITEEAGGLAFDDCRRRLLKALLRFSRSAAATATGDGVLLRMTHEQLAQAIGAARETITLVLTDLRNHNVLRTGRNRLTFNPQVLSNELNAVS